MNTERWLSLLFFVAATFISIISIKSNEPLLFIWVSLVVTVALVFLLVSISQIKNSIRKKLPLCRRKRVPQNWGVFGRDDLIDSLLKWHNEDTTNKVALISGAAGAGKTTLAKTLKKSVIASSSIIIVDKGNKFYDEVADINTVSDNSIIIFDYVLESLSHIEKYVDQLFAGSHKKMISIILLERDAATSTLKRIIEGKNYKFLQINLDEYQLGDNYLTDIIEFQVKNEPDKDAKKREISRDEAAKIAKIITETIDIKYRRPIFAVILATIYRRRESFNDSIQNYNDLFSEYWDVVTGFHKFLRDEDTHNDATINYVNVLKNNVKLVSLLATITALQIRCCPIGNDLEIKLFNSSGREENNNSLLELIIEALHGSRAPYSNMVSWLRFLYQHNYSISKDPWGIYILPMNLDMFSSWMLYQSLKENVSQLTKWFSIISKANDNKYYSETYIFVIRASEIFGYEIFEWFQAIDIPAYSQLYRWKQDFVTDINAIFIPQSLDKLEAKMKYFKLRYQNFCATIQNPSDIQHITRDIIDMINLEEEHTLDRNQYQMIFQWRDERIQELTKAGLTLK